VDSIGAQGNHPVSYMVIYNTDGQPSYHEVDELDAAASFVEELRNTKGIERARLVSLKDVGFEFRTYYRVEVAETTGTATTTTSTRSTATTTTTPAVPPRPVSRVEVDDDFGVEPKTDAPGYDSQPAAWNVGVGTDPALPSDLLDGEEVGANVRRGLFGR
jgi:hypothetical protein